MLDRRLTPLSAILLLGLLGACAAQPPVVTPTPGKTFTARPATCPITFADVDDPKFVGGVVPYRDTASYDEVAMIELERAPQDYTPSLEALLRAEACKLGGDVVVWLAHFPPAVGGSPARFTVYRAKEKP
jgi:hypothetical protein